MFFSKERIVVALALACALCLGTARGSPVRAVSLSRDEIARLGLATAPAQPARFTPRVRGYGVVISMTSIAQADADYRTADASAVFSKSQLERAQRLYSLQALSRMAVETARRQADSDAAALALADRKEAATFGQNAPWRGPPRNEGLLDRLAAGDSTLIEATFPLGIALPAHMPQLAVERIDPQPEHPNWSSHVVWNAPADPAIPGRNVFALVERSGLALGEHALVFVPVGAELSGVRIPLDAVVLNEDKAWCYVQIGPGLFRRVPVDVHRELDGGYFVAQGIAPGQAVVTSGVGLLLAHELGPATPGGD